MQQRNLEIAARVWAGDLSSQEYEAKRLTNDSAPDKRLARGITLSQDRDVTEIAEADLERMRKEVIDWTSSGALR